MKPYWYMLLEGQKVSLGVHPDSVITQDYSLADGRLVHVIVGEEEQTSHLPSKESLTRKSDLSKQHREVLEILL